MECFCDLSRNSTTCIVENFKKLEYEFEYEFWLNCVWLFSKAIIFLFGFCWKPKHTSITANKSSKGTAVATTCLVINFCQFSTIYDGYLGKRISNNDDQIRLGMSSHGFIDRLISNSFDEILN